MTTNKDREMATNKEKRSMFNSKTLGLIAGLVAVATLVGSAQAATIQFDLNDSKGSYSGAEAPAQDAGDLTASDTNWNTLNGDAASGFVYTDGSAASGITVDFGSGTGNIDWSAEPLLANGDPDAASGIYNTALMEDWMFTIDKNLGVRVKGLAAGEYTVYALVKEFNQTGRTYDVGIGVDTDGTVALGDLTNQSIGTGLPATWTAGTNYVEQTVTVSSVDDWIVIITDNTNNRFATLQGFQIVPEPGSLALIGLVGMTLVTGRRRRR